MGYQAVSIRLNHAPSRSPGRLAPLCTRSVLPYSPIPYAITLLRMTDAERLHDIEQRPAARPDRAGPWTRAGQNVMVVPTDGCTKAVGIARASACTALHPVQCAGSSRSTPASTNAF